MAIQISGTTVIDNSRNLSNIATFDATVTSVYDAVSVGGTASITNRRYYYAASGATVTLPTPTIGNEVIISVGDYTNVIVNPGASYKIMGQAVGETMTINRAYASIKFIYVDSTNGWVIS